MATLAQLRTQIRYRTNQESTTFVTDSELTDYINQSTRELYDLLVAAYEDYFTTATSFTIAGGASTKTLTDIVAAGVYKVLGLDWQYETGLFETLPQWHFGDRNRDTRRSYRVIGGAIHILPTTLAPGTYKLWAIPYFTALSADGDVFDGISGWDEYVIVDASIKVRDKAEEDPSVLIAQKGELLKRIQAMAQNRAAGEHQSIRDVRYLARTRYDRDDILLP